MINNDERLKIKKICHLTDIDITDIVECVECYKNQIDNNDYRKARIIKYVLYTILNQNANDIGFLKCVKNAISEIKSYEKLFSYKKLNKRKVGK